MIPLSMTVENFKCYRTGAPTLHLEGVHIACLCGGNGNGKSSLLDAMTWALWGEEVHRPQEELIHIGQMEMRVELEFIAGGRKEGEGAGQRYRVQRRYSKGRGGRAGGTDLQLQVATTGQPGNQEFRSISGSVVRETQAAINKLVGMDYATFVNSAFLVQGRADEFTTKRPAERQRVLAKVLDLERYDRLQDLAKGKSRERASAIQLLAGQAQAWDQQLAQRPEHHAELPVVEEAMAATGKELASGQAEQATLRDEAASLRERKRELEDMERQAQGTQEELRQLEGQALQHRRRVQAWEALTGREQAINLSYGRLLELRQRDEAMNRLMEPYGRLQERLWAVHQRAQDLPRLEKDLASAQSEQAGLAQREVVVEERRQELQRLEVERGSLAAENDRLRGEMQELRKKVDMLALGDARCPLCGTELGTDGRKHIEQEYAGQGRTMADLHRQNQARLRVVEPRCKELEEWSRREERDVAERRRTLLARVGSLGQQAEEARKAPAELALVENELGTLAYDPAGHKQMRDVLKGLSVAEQDHRLLQDAKGGLPEEREALARVEGMIVRRKEEASKSEARRQTLRLETADLPTVEGRLREAEARLAQTQARQGQLVARKGYLEERLREYEALELRKAEAGKQLAALAQERQVYDDLATAFGRTGVQALIIEAAIPQLEEQANTLLGRMTDNTMHLRLETQRETQRGGAVETLEIKVADALGTRSYETFSGGEAFRINLALRIGLSKMLAHRAGAPLPTLFIDEGFGTQDAAGRERILDVINSIADDFECILVITHMEEVKDVFPVRIEVQKTEVGSTFVMA